MTTAETITVNDSVTLHAVNESHVSGLHQLVLRNKAWLQQTLNWPQYVNSEQDSRQNVQGKGTLSAALQAFIHYYAERGEIRRFVIKCRVDNLRSNQVALRNGFQLEGCLRQAEFLNGVYHDQNIYARIVDATTL